MDSIALAWWKRPAVAFTIDYGQMCAEAEIRAAGAVCSDLRIRHEVIRVDCRSLGSGDLAGLPADAAAPVREWWPYRNQLLMTLAGMRGIALGVKELMVGSVKSDESHADGRPEFIVRLDALMMFQEGGVRATAPAIGMSSVELVQTSGIPIETLAWSHSCHRSDYACGDCRGCYKHQETMNALGFGAY